MDGGWTDWPIEGSDYAYSNTPRTDAPGRNAAGPVAPLGRTRPRRR